MPSPIAFLDTIDLQRSRRARELSSLKTIGSGLASDVFGINSKSVIVLSYAHWEGFYNDCVRTYINALKYNQLRVQDVEWMMLAGVVVSEFSRLKDRNHSAEARCDFIEALKVKLDTSFENFDVRAVEASSNLDFTKLVKNYRLLNFDLAPFQRCRIRLDKEIVGWRHSVAHGDSPDLSGFDVSSHVDFTNGLLLTLADQFQAAIIARS